MRSGSPRGRNPGGIGRLSSLRSVLRRLHFLFQSRRLGGFLLCFFVSLLFGRCGGFVFGLIEFFYLLGRKRAAAIITFQLPDFPVKMKWTGACRALIVCNLVRHTNLHNWKTRIPQLYVTAESAKYITIFPV